MQKIAAVTAKAPVGQHRFPQSPLVLRGNRTSAARAVNSGALGDRQRGGRSPCRVRCRRAPCRARGPRSRRWFARPRRLAGKCLRQIVELGAGELQRLQRHHGNGIVERIGWSGLRISSSSALAAASLLRRKLGLGLRAQRLLAQTSCGRSRPGCCGSSSCAFSGNSLDLRLQRVDLGDADCRWRARPPRAARDCAHGPPAAPGTAARQTRRAGSASRSARPLPAASRALRPPVSMLESRRRKSTVS